MQKGNCEVVWLVAGFVCTIHGGYIDGWYKWYIESIGGLNWFNIDNGQA